MLAPVAHRDAVATLEEFLQVVRVPEAVGFGDLVDRIVRVREAVSDVCQLLLTDGGAHGRAKDFTEAEVEKATRDIEMVRDSGGVDAVVRGVTC